MTVSVIESPSTGQRPDRIAPQLDARALLSLLDEVRPLLNEQQVPTDSGFLSWLSYRKLAVPVSALTRIPAWLTDSALIRCLDLPPAGGRLPASPDRRRRHLLVTVPRPRRDVGWPGLMVRVIRSGEPHSAQRSMWDTGNQPGECCG
jgi:hypothetical protein